MNMKYSYHIHKYDTRHSHDLCVSDCTTSAYENSIFIMDIKSYNKLPEKIKILHCVIKKRVEISICAEWSLYCRGIYTGSIVVAVCIGNWVNKRNCTNTVNFIYSCNHLVALSCEMFCVWSLHFICLWAWYVYCCNLSSAVWFNGCK